MLAMEVQVMDEEYIDGFDELNLKEIIDGGSLDFDSWTLLISEVEKTYPDNIEMISLVYDSFLSEFPLCYGYWRKYANHKAHLCTVEKAIKVFEHAVQSATYSVDVWLDYCSFSMLVFEDPCDIRRLFNRGLSFVGKDYLCCSLWDKYIEFEFYQKHWSFLAQIYIQALKFPTKKLRHYYDSFKKLAAIWKEEIGNNYTDEVQPESVVDCETTICKDDEIMSVIKDLLDQTDGSLRSTALQKYVSVGEHLYQGACQLDETIHDFEKNIRRPYFHVKPLDEGQIENWHNYLDYVEMHGDFDWAVKLYERCLISCANIPEFWMRYVEFAETKGGREMAKFSLDRATKVFLKRVPAIHHFNARYKEQIGDTFGARTAYLNCDADSDSIFVENVVKQANMEKRLGNFVAAANIYKEALEMATKKQKLHTLPDIYVPYSRLKYIVTGSAGAARDVLIDGIKQLPHSKLLLKELINFEMLHGGSTDTNLICSVVYDAISQGTNEAQGFSTKDGEDISKLYLEVVDFYGTIEDIRKAWIRHIRLFPHSITTSTSTCPVSRKTFLKKTINDFHHVSDHLQSRKSSNNTTEGLEHESPIVLERSTEDVRKRSGSTVSVLEKVSNDMQQDHDHILEQDLNQFSLENLSLNNAQHNDCLPPDPTPNTAHDYDAPQKTCMLSESTLDKGSPNRNKIPSVTSPIGTLAADSSTSIAEPVVDLSSCIRDENSVLLEPQMHANSGDCQLQINNSENQVKLSDTHVETLQTVQNQELASPSQPQVHTELIADPQGQNFQYTVSSNDQSSQAYHQMWQYYYYQQQQILQQQQYYHHQQQQPQLQQLQGQQVLQQEYYHQQLQMQQQYYQQQQQYYQHQQQQQFYQQQQLQQQQPYQGQQVQQHNPSNMQQLQNQQYPQQQEQPQLQQLPPPELLEQLLQQQQWKKQQQIEQDHKQDQPPASPSENQA